MVAVFDDRYPDVLGEQLLGNPCRVGPGDVLIPHAMQQAHRTVDRNRTFEQQMSAPIFDQLKGDSNYEINDDMNATC